jgi:hypothetical protein
VLFESTLRVNATFFGVSEMVAVPLPALVNVRFLRRLPFLVIDGTGVPVVSE